MYVFVRNDLTYAQKAVQSSHSCIEAARHFLKPNEEHPSVIVFGIKNENKLLSIIDRLNEAGIPFREFREPDIGNQLTSLATAPVFGKDREVFSKYCLLR